MKINEILKYLKSWGDEIFFESRGNEITGVFKGQYFKIFLRFNNKPISKRANKQISSILRAGGFCIIAFTLEDIKDSFEELNAKR